jgi:dolichyl-diphosphooligosaccharide--protein glycosyltransferase
MSKKEKRQKEKQKESLPPQKLDPPFLLPDWLKIVVGIAMAIFVGLYVRFDDLNKYISNPQKNFQNTPILTTADAYFFTRFAREYMDETYKSDLPDPHRDVPDCTFTYPNPIPMVSYLAATISKKTNIDLYHVAFYMPAILAVLCVIPIFLVGRELSGFYSGLLGAILAVSFVIYLGRSCLGRFDTDCLNLFFPFFACYFLLLSWKTSSAKRVYLFSALAGLSMLLFDWWYAHPGFILPILFFYGVLLFIPNKKNPSPNKVKFLKIIVFIILANPGQLIRAMHSVYSFFVMHIFLKATEYGFPNILQSVSESTNYDVERILRMMHPFIGVGICSLIGLVWLIIRSGRKFLVVLPILGLGLLTFKSGNRFGMFLAPFLGMGLGVLADQLQAKIIDRFIKQKIVYALISCVLIMVGLGATISPNSVLFEPEPRFEPEIYKCFDSLKDISKDGYVCTWWDWGYAIEDIAHKSTFTDGGSYGKAYFVGKTLSQTDPAKARNVMLGLSNIGLKGITDRVDQNKLPTPASVIEEMVDGKFNAPPKHPIYIAFTSDMISKFGWIYFFGTWDFDKLKGTMLSGLQEFNPRGIRDNVIYCDTGAVDMNNGNLMTSAQNQIPIEKFWSIDFAQKNAAPVLVKDFGKSGIQGMFLAKGKTLHKFIAINPAVMDTVFIQMYLFRNYDKNIFEVVYDDFPTALIYRIK